MTSAAILTVDVIRSKALAAKVRGRPEIGNLCAEIKAFLDDILTQIDSEPTLTTTPRLPLGDSIEYLFKADTKSEIANLGIRAIICAFLTAPSGKLFRYTFIQR